VLSGEEQLRRQFGTEEQAAKLAERLVSSQVSLVFRMYIEASEFFFLATANAKGECDCSFRGGGPGTVRVLDPQTLVFPDYPGNGLYQSLGNVLENPHVGMLFIDFAKGQRLRVNGTARLSTAEEDVARFPGALSVAYVTVSEVYTNCSKRIPKLVKAN
jgi:predicted pyridoxine 5'-phosphate oxidase superfamily flavin-nucleotide-binding protein